MLIVLGGLLGSGRRILAHKLAMQHGLYPYDIDEKKLRRFSKGEGGNIRIRQPWTDEERTKLFDMALRDFPMLSKMYPDVIINDAFHRTIPREHFFSGVRKFYDPVVFIWVESDEASTAERLKRAQSLGLVNSPAAALRIRKIQSALLQLPDTSVPRFEYSMSAKDQVAALWELIQQQARSV